MCLVNAALAALLELEVLDDIGDVELRRARSPWPQAPAQACAPGRPDERPPLAVLAVARHLADEHDPGALRGPPRTRSAWPLVRWQPRRPRPPRASPQGRPLRDELARAVRHLRAAAYALPSPGTLSGVTDVDRPPAGHRGLRALATPTRSLPVRRSGMRAMVPDVRMAGPAFTVVADDDHLPVFSALAEARPGDVLVIATGGGSARSRRAVRHRGAGAAGSPASSSTACAATGGAAAQRAAGVRPRHDPALGLGRLARRRCDGRVRCGGVDVAPGDLVFGDDDGVVDRARRSASRPRWRPPRTIGARRARDARGDARAARRCTTSPARPSTSPGWTPASRAALTFQSMSRFAGLDARARHGAASSTPSWPAPRPACSRSAAGSPTRRRSPPTVLDEIVARLCATTRRSRSSTRRARASPASASTCSTARSSSRAGGRRSRS